MIGKKKLIIIFACCLFNLDNNQLIFVNELINQRIANENRFDIDILMGDGWVKVIFPNCYSILNGTLNCYPTKLPSKHKHK